MNHGVLDVHVRLAQEEVKAWIDEYQGQVGRGSLLQVLKQTQRRLGDAARYAESAALIERGGIFHE